MYEEAATQNAKEMIQKYGNVLEVTLDGGEVEVLFEKGVLATLGSLFRYGYSGTGSICLATWLRTAGFSVTDQGVATMKAPKVLRRPGVSDEILSAARSRAQSRAAKKWWQFWK